MRLTKKRDWELGKWYEVANFVIVETKKPAGSNSLRALIVVYQFQLALNPLK